MKNAWKRPGKFAQDNGITPQLVTNWIARGYLKRMVDKNNVVFVKRTEKRPRKYLFTK